MALQAVALVAALEVVVRKVLVKVPLNLLGRVVLLAPALDSEAFVVQRKHQFVGVALRPSAELSAIVGQDGLDLYAEGFVEGKHTVVEQLGGGDGHLRGIDLGSE